VDPLLEKLEQRGVSDMRLTYRDNQWWFSCDVPNPANRQTARHFEGHDYSRYAAVRGVVDRIEKELGK
jgi:hypothetical protein